MNNIIDSEYKNWLYDLKKRYISSQIKAAVKVNSELLKFYWLLGKDIVAKQCENKWGSSFFNNLSKDLKIEIPESKGFSVTNLKYMKYFYELYAPLLIRPQLGDGELQQEIVRPQLGDFENNYIFCIPWGHTKLIIDRCKDNINKALFYTKKTIENNWSRAVLLNFLDTDLYERQGKAITNFSETLPAIQGELAQQLTKDPYSFDFLTLTEKYEEKELKNALIQNIERFLLELGKGFAYMGREYRIQIGSEEKFIDMLFYNVNLRCYVVIEVKIEKFEASYLGQLGLYVSSVNHLLKKEYDNPTIGLLICKSKDDIVARYALESSTVPIGISEYELQKIFPKDFKSSLPSIEEIERKLKI